MFERKKSFSHLALDRLRALDVMVLHICELWTVFLNTFFFLKDYFRATNKSVIHVFSCYSNNAEHLPNYH